jgi:type IV pilus assembly protein PilF
MIRGCMRIALVCASFALSACVTEQTDQLPKPRPELASDLNLKLGYDYFRRGKLPEAKEKFDRAVEQNPRSANAQTAAGLLYERLGEPKIAEKHFARAIALEPKNPDIQNNYATFLCARNRHELGEKYALQAAANPLYRTPEFAYLNAGNCASAAGKLNRAEEHYRRSLQIRSRFGEALYKMADLEYRQTNYLAARGFLERYLELGRTDASTLWLALRIERSLGNDAAAQSYAQRLKSEYPSAMETRELLEYERNSG